MTAPWRIFALAAAAVALLGCDQKQAAQEPPKPREIAADSIGHFCGMSLAEHPGPKGQIFVGGSPDPVWFASVRETFAFTMLPEEPKSIAAIYVTDIGKAIGRLTPDPGTWIDARKAYYVIGGRRLGGMGEDEAMPFAEEARARQFAVEGGGRVVAFGEMPEDYILQYGDEKAKDRAADDREEARTP
jgi:copper chaperone NosL